MPLTFISIIRKGDNGSFTDPKIHPFERCEAPLLRTTHFVYQYGQVQMTTAIDGNPADMSPPSAPLAAQSLPTLLALPDFGSTLALRHHSKFDCLPHTRKMQTVSTLFNKLFKSSKVPGYETNTNHSTLATQWLCCYRYSL